MAIKQKIKFKDEINFEADQQDPIKKTAGIQSLADQVEKLESLQQRLETTRRKYKKYKTRDTESIWRHHTYNDVRDGSCRT